MAGNPFPQSREQLLQAYRTMRTIREFEDRLHIDFGRGDIPGFVHLYAGAEAAGIGIMMHLGAGDRIASTHRGHGHCIAKGVDPLAMMKEIYGKKGGSCEGKGGSMHIADLGLGMMGANGIRGAGAPRVCGALEPQCGGLAGGYGTHDGAPTHEVLVPRQARAAFGTPGFAAPQVAIAALKPRRCLASAALRRAGRRRNRVAWPRCGWPRPARPRRRWARRIAPPTASGRGAALAR